MIHLKKWLLLIFTIIVLTINIYNVQAVYINDCISVQNDTTYILNQSFTTNESKCFDFTYKENITLDGNGYMINNTINNSLIYIDFSNDIEIKNLNIWGWGFRFHTSDNIRFINNTVEGNAFNHLANVSNVVIEESRFTNTNASMDHIISSSDYIWNLTFNNNIVEGLCNHNAVFSIANTLHNVSIYDNYFNTSCPCVALGKRHGIGIELMPSGNIEIYNNDFFMYNENGFFCIQGLLFGENSNVSIHENMFNSKGKYAIYFNLPDVLQNLEIKNNIYYAYGKYGIYMENVSNAIVDNETFIVIPEEYAIYLYDTHAYVTNSKFNSTLYEGSRVINYDINPPFRNTTFENCELYGNRAGLTSDFDGIAYVYDSIIDGIQHDVFARYDGNIILYNTNIDTYNIESDSELNVYWKLFIDNSLFNSSVKLYDLLSNLLLDSTNSTIDLWVKEYNVISENQKTDLTPHNLEWEKSNYYNNFTSFNMNINRNFILYLTEKANISFQLPFETIGMYPFESKCLDNETLYIEYKKQSCIYTECYELSDVQIVNCPYGCTNEFDEFGSGCIKPDWQMYGFIIIVFVIIIILALYFKRKD